MSKHIEEKEPTNLELSMSNPFDSIHTCCAFWVGDWAENHRLAWIYGIVCGWDEYQEFKDRFGWDDETIDRLKHLRKQYQKANVAYTRRLKEGKRKIFWEKKSPARHALSQSLQSHSLIEKEILRFQEKEGIALEPLDEEYRPRPRTVGEILGDTENE